MKKAALFILAFSILILAVFPVFGEGIKVTSEKGDKVSLFEDVEINKDFKGNVIVVLGNVNINSKVDGLVVTVFGDTNINSNVTGQVVTVFGNTKLSSKADLGSLITLGSIQKEDGARIRGEEVRIFGSAMNMDVGSIIYLEITLVILFSIAVLVLGLLILAINRKKYETITKEVEFRIDRKLLLGFLAFVGISIITALISITLIAPVIYFIILVIAAIASSILFGRLILKALIPSRNIFAEFVTGLVTITLVKVLLINLAPSEDLFIGFIILGTLEVFIDSIGLGILLDARAAKK